MANVLIEQHPANHLQSPSSPSTIHISLPPLAYHQTATTSGGASMTTSTATTSTPLRSERLLRDMLTKDVVARSRSLSRSSSTNHHPQLQQQQAPPPPLPFVAAPPTSTTSPFKPSTTGAVKNGSVSGHSRSSSGTDDRAIFASHGAGPALGFRPQPSIRRTFDGVPPTPHFHANSPPPLQTMRQHTSPLPLSGSGLSPTNVSPPSLVHANTSSLIGARPSSRLPTAAAATGLGQTPDVDGDWSYEEECASPSPTSIHSSSSSRESLHHSSMSPNHQPLTPPHPHTGAYYHRSQHHPSHLLPDTPPSSSTFNLESASQYCRQQVGYVSFGDIEGLGRPAAEEEEERLERLRLTREGEGGKGKWLWGLFTAAVGVPGAAGGPSEEAAARTGAIVGGRGGSDVGVRRPKTPGVA